MRIFLAIATFLSVIISLNAQDNAVDNVAPKSPCYQKVMGEVRDGVTRELLPNTIVSLQTDDGNPVATQMVKKDGKFEFKVDCSAKYRLKASKKTYTLESKKFTTTDLAGAELKTKIFLDKGSIDFVKPERATKIAKSKAKESEAQITASIDNVKPIGLLNEESRTTKEVAENKIETNANEEIAAVEEEPISTENVVAKKAQEVVAKPEPKPMSEVKIAKNIDNKDVLVLEPVLFDYESSYLNARAKQELKKIVKIMKKNPDMVLECASYTDAKGPENYNMWMSKRRAKRTVEYLVKRGVPASRISGKGYGETKLINNCEDDCSDEERQVNRRTEFIIIKN